MPDLEHYLSKKCGFDVRKILVKPSQAVSLTRDFDPDYTGEFKEKIEVERLLQDNTDLLMEQQDN
jgi:hypothetical protein